MRALIQRVTRASVSVEGEVISAIERGLLIFLGVHEDDGEEDLQWLSRKITRMRIFADEQEKLNLSLADLAAEVLVVSQFTLLAQTAKGNRPSFTRAAPPEKAKALYEQFCGELETLLGQAPAQGQFAANMQVELCNDGPLTFWLDSQQRDV